MNDRILPNVTHQINMESGETLYVNGCFDSIHYFEPLNVHWLRYFDEQDPENPFKMVVLTDAGADVIIEKTNIPYVPRETVFSREHKNLVQVLGGWITESMFEIDIDESVILAQEALSRSEDIESPENE